ncbi:MAG: hypothetical protein H6707_20190 [Deltaproteobacteria bacterium]|nr:hypothetical protein [Deltaproteobacteria bacterium]
MTQDRLSRWTATARGLAIAIAILLLPAAATARKHASARSPQTSKRTDSRYYQSPLVKYSPMTEYAKLLASDYRTSGKLELLLQDAPYWQKAEHEFGTLSLQQKTVLAIARDQHMRTGLVTTSQAELDARSNQIATGLKRAQRSGKFIAEAQVFDEIHIGGGTADTIMTSVAARKGSQQRILTIEESRRYTSTFATLDEAGFINSSNYGPERKLQVDKWGVPDSFHGLVDLSHASPLYMSPFRDLGGIAAIDRALTPYPILFDRSVISLEDRNASGDKSWPTRYRVMLGTGEVVFSERIVFTAGLGDSQLPNLDPASNALLQAELKGPNPKVMHSDTFMAEVADPTNLTPLERHNGKDIAVVGPHDSGYMTTKYLFRRALEGAYGYSNSFTGSPRVMHWIGISGKTIRTHVEYGRPWYTDLTEHVGDHELIPHPTRLASVKKLKSGRFQMTMTDGSKTEVDEIIFATGKKGRMDQILSKIVKVDGKLIDSNQVERVGGRGRLTYRGKARSKKPVNFTAALKLKGQDIYFAGAMVADKIVPKRDVQAEDPGSIVYVHPRTAALAERLAKMPSIHGAKEKQRRRFALKGAKGTRAFVLSTAKVAMQRTMPALDDVVLEANLLSTLKQRFTAADDKSLLLTFYGDGKGALKLRVSGLAERSAKLLTRAIGDNAQLLRQVSTIVAPDRTSNHKLTLRLVRDADGELTIDQKIIK